jgi:polyribonucleotide nucleotidyltransferase
MPHSVTIKIGDKELILETGKMAKQANGSVFARFGDSAVLATACCGGRESELDYVPLQVEYNEKFYAAGKIPGGFLKREARPKDKEILVSRMIDRPMRPLFSKKFGREIQVVPTVISADQINPPDVIAMVASSAAVTISDIPFDGPTGSVRVCYLDGELILNPTFKQIEASELEILVAGTEHGITMVEGGGKEVSEDLMIKAISKAEVTIKEICNAQIELARLAGKEKLPLPEVDESFPKKEDIIKAAYSLMEEACFVKGKMERYAAIKQVKNDIFTRFEEDIPEEQIKLFNEVFEELESTIVRKSIIEKGIRTDGRGPEDIRPISGEIKILPRTHGSALFTRGETQALAVTTLGTVFDEQMKDDIDGEKRFDNFMLHYNFPPFSVGETGRLGTGRREIGHGHLARRAIAGVLPSKEDFPYTIRVVSEVLESNGSSSMATVCGGSLSLLQAGVPIKKPVAGIAMGLISDETNTVVLSDILGEEDHLGDMDFKVAGTEDGITAFQMDIKIKQVTAEIMARALDQAHKGRLHILGIMNEVISTPESSISEYAPKISTIKVEQDKIGAVIGPGGKNVKAISEKTDTTVNIDNDGTITIYSKNQEGANLAEEMIRGLVEEPEVGKVYLGTVKRIVDFGAFVEILPGKDGLCHISKLSRQRVEKVSDVLKLEQQIKVKIIEVDRMGRINLSYIDAIDPQGSSHQDHRKPRHDSGRSDKHRH